MAHQTGLQALIVTKSTLKWFVIIGVIIAIVGFVLSFFIFGGVMIFWVGVLLIGFAVVGLLYLWLTDKYLTKPQRHTIPRR